jgi:hypothetical protein
MISISFTEPCTNVWKKWREKCETEQLTHNSAYATGKIAEVSGKLYRERKDVYFALNGPFHGKCVYCETLIVANHPGDLDHFRPKNRVTDFNGTVMIKDGRGIDIPHKGYYWLAYDFRNLLPACEDCNRPSKARSRGILIGKRDIFPVKGDFRAESPGEERREKPLLLNPTAKKIEKHLIVNEKGFIIPQTTEGKICCKVFGLNERQALVQERMDAYMTGKDSVLRYLNARGHNDVDGAAIHLKTMLEYEVGVKPYSAAGRAGINAMFKRLAIDKSNIIPKSMVKQIKKDSYGK